MLATLRLPLKYFYYGRRFCHSSDNLKMLIQHSATNYEDILHSTHDLECNLAARNKTPAVDLSALKELHRIYLKAIARKRNLKKLEECNSYESRQFESLEVYLRNLKMAAFKYLITLPNKLDERTPCGNEDTVIFTKCSDIPANAEDHVSIGEKLNVLRYEDKITYYLENDAAKLELAVIRFLNNLLLNERKFKPFRNPDTCNRFVLEGVVVDELPKHAIRLLDSYYVLMGGASLASFCAVRIDTSTHRKFMPEHFFTCGRNYAPELNSSGLFGVCQRTDVSIFVTTSSTEQMWCEFDTNLRWMIELFESFGLDFRVCYNRAASLTMAECCRATIQLYSAYEKKFIDAARLSVYEAFISKRLKILCHDAKSETGLVYIIDGVVISVPSLIACLLERSSDRLFIPDCIRPFMPK